MEVIEGNFGVPKSVVKTSDLFTLMAEFSLKDEEENIPVKGVALTVAEGSYIQVSSTLGSIEEIHAVLSAAASVVSDAILEKYTGESL